MFEESLMSRHGCGGVLGSLRRWMRVRAGALSTRRRGIEGVAASACLVLLLSGPVHAQHDKPDGESGSQHDAASREHDHHAPASLADHRWEGSAEGKAYSEFNHHLAGVFVLLIGLTELRQALTLAVLAWTRLLLPIAMLGVGGFLLIWSDHDAWPIGSLSFAQTYFGGDWETLQHKLYACLLLTVGSVEWLRRTGRITQARWSVPLPASAIVGGLMLFLHSHGVHPAAHEIALHHAVMGFMAISAGSCKLASERATGSAAALAAAGSPSWWGRSLALAWAGFLLLIGAQLLIYAE